MRNLFITTTILLTMLTKVNAQNFEIPNESPNQSTNSTSKSTQRSGLDRSRVVFGGGVGLSFGDNDYWSVNLSPQIGYRVTPNFIAGGGVSYAHSGENWDNYKYSQDYAGFNLYGEYYLMNWLVFRVKPEILYMWESVKVDTPSGHAKFTNDEFVPAVLVGGGVYFHPMSITLNYDLVQDDNTPYGDNVFVSVGFNF